MRETVRNNKVHVSGIIVGGVEYSHEVFGEAFYTFPLETRRTSGQVDTLSIMVSERAVDLNTLQGGEAFEVVGQVRTYNKHENTRNRLIINVFASELYPVEREENDINEVYIEGYICKEPVYRKTPLGREIGDALVAVNRPYGKSDYIPCITWGRNARFSSGLEVGTKVSISGRLQSRVYTKKISDTQVEEHIAYELSAGKIEVISE